MKHHWPQKTKREQHEIEGFILAYSHLPNGRSFLIESKQETPDYFLKDGKTGEIFGVELTSVYKDNRSVPDEHMKPVMGFKYIYEDPLAIEQHNLRLIETIKEKVQKARKHYNTIHPLILAIFINEYISIYMWESDWEELVHAHESIFDDIKPFSEIVLWNLVNKSAMSIVPTES